MHARDIAGRGRKSGALVVGDRRSEGMRPSLHTGRPRGEPGQSMYFSVKYWNVLQFKNRDESRDENQGPPSGRPQTARTDAPLQA